MNKNTICKVNNCVDVLYEKDRYLFDCKVCERCLMFRLAYYLQAEFKEYYVDCEFNKLGFDGNKQFNKVEVTLEGELKDMYADIIIHKRNSMIKDNFICIELKRTKRRINNDIVRLAHMTRKEGFVYGDTKYVYSYSLGFLIYLPKNKRDSEIKIFEKGKEINYNILKQ